MPNPKPKVCAALFDLDGTLVDSERATDAAIREVMARHGIDHAELPPGETRGRTWVDITRSILSRWPGAAPAEVIAAELDVLWVELSREAPPIPGAPEAVARAKEVLSVAVVSSSSVPVIGRSLVRLAIDGLVPLELRVGAERVTRPKPDPEGYQLAASLLGVAPSACVVFEDSLAGLTAARAAGMRAVLVEHSAAELDACRALADATCRHYRALPEDFFSALARGELELGGRGW